MNRFRVWDGIGKKMWYPEQGLKACITQVGTVCVDETDDGGILENRNYRLKALFWTGLTDKNGKEIYEGDVVKWYGFEVSGGKQIRPERILTVNEFIKDTHRLICITEGTGQTVEVIGNVHSNPELLEG